MARGVAPLLTAALLAVPAVVAFASGGTTDVARLTLAIAACALLALAAVPTPGRLLPASRAGRVALGALAGLTAWTALSHGWSPAPARADAAVELAVTYLALAGAASLLLRARPLARAAEPALALGGFVVIAYALAGRVLPGVVHLAASARAGGRLEQPLTYWNAMGALAAVALVLAARVAGDVTRPAPLRAAAAAATPALGAGVFLSFSRTALAAVALGVLLLVALTPDRAQARAAVVAAVGGALGVAATAPLDGVRALAGSLATREAQGAASLVLLVAATAATAGLHLLVADRASPGRHLPQGLRRAAAAAAIAVVLVPFAAALADRNDGGAATFGASSSRLTATGSNRADYWRVALDTFADHPLRGVGAGSFDATWLQQRPIAERVRNAHSLELETAAELGLAGLALLALLLGGVAVTARTLARSDAALAAGPAAALAAWLLHASVDWDWQVPALTAIAAILTGLLVARAGVWDRPPVQRASDDRGQPPEAPGGTGPGDPGDLTLAPPPGHPRFPMLDGIRAMAALSVVVFHVSDSSGIIHRGALGAFTARLNVGVALFFVLSGFLLYRPFVAARLDGSPLPSAGRYLWRRALRIVPAYWVALAVLSALGWITLTLGWWRYAFFAQTFDVYSMFSGITAAWTLDIEVLFYLALPLWAFGARAVLRGRPRADQLRIEAIGVASLAVAGFLVRLVAGIHDDRSLWLVSFPAHLDWFAGGMALALLTLWTEQRGIPRPLRLLARRPALAWAGALAAYLLVAYAVGLPRGLTPATTGRDLAGHELYLVVAVLLTIPAVLGVPAHSGAASRAVGRVLAHPTVAWLGLISYGIYLWHQPFLHWLVRIGFLDHAPFLEAGLLLVVTVAGAVALGAASHYLVEKPFLRLKEPRRRRHREPEPEPAPATAG